MHIKVLWRRGWAKWRALEFAVPELDREVPARGREIHLPGRGKGGGVLESPRLCNSHAQVNSAHSWISLSSNTAFAATGHALPGLLAGPAPFHTSSTRTMALKRAVYELGRMARETGQALDKVGLKVLNKPVFKESCACPPPWRRDACGTAPALVNARPAVSRHRAVMNLYEHHPDVSVDAFVAPNASVVGNVFIGMRASVWYGAVLRGEEGC